MTSQTSHAPVARIQSTCFILFLYMAVMFLVCSPLAVAKSPLPARSAWTVMEQDGVQWLRTPDGQPFFSKGVNVFDWGPRNA